MDFSRTAFQIAYGDVSELREQAKTMTMKELAEVNNVSYGKMATILRLSDIKARKPVRPPRPRKEKVKQHKKDHTITTWAQQFNHGRLRYVYYDMIRRCHNEKDKHYDSYGKRGITVCDEWREDCCNFYRWAKETGYAEGLQLDRKDNNGNYCPENCHWVTPLDNAYNKRNTRLVTYKGETKNLREWAKDTGISKYILADRIYKYKWDIERALTQLVK
jgi:hypothetical protein